VILYDFQEDKIVYANGVFLRMLKYEEEEVIGKSVLALVDPKDLERVERLIGKSKSRFQDARRSHSKAYDKNRKS
jgi:PAS domain S-box-containing protein